MEECRATLASNLASGSDVTWEGNKFTNAKLGITGLMEQNGYICFGKNFGGLILQWGYTNANTHVNFPITFTSFVSIICNCLNENWAWINGYSLTGFTLRADGDSFWFAIGA